MGELLGSSKPSCNPPISVTKLNQFPKARKRVFPAFARRHTGHSGITQQFGFGGFRPGPRPRPEAAYLGRRGAAAVESGGLVMAANREESLEKISTRGGVRPAEVVSGDMMALRPVGATIGPADLARRAAPRSGRFAVAASHRAREVTPLRISPEVCVVARSAGG